MPCGSKESHDRRVERMVRESGWASIASERLDRPAPSFRVSELAVEGIAADWLPGAVLDLRGAELSNAPWLVDGAPTLELTSRDRTVGFAVNLAPASRGGGLGGLRLHWNGLSVDDAMSMLRIEGEAPLRGGTLDVSLEGTWADGVIGAIDAPLRVTIRGATVAVPGVEEVVLDELVLPIHLSGTITSPVVHFDTRSFAETLVQAAREELEQNVRAEVEQRLEDEARKALGELQESTGIEIPVDIGGTLEKEAGGLLEGATGGSLGGALGGLRKKKW
jgi:hypothetical protein